MLHFLKRSSFVLLSLIPTATRLRCPKAEDLTGHDNNNQKDDHANGQAYAHLHILPPHLLADSVGTATEALSGDSQVVGLILQGIQALATLGNLVDVVSHDADGAVDFL